MKSNKQWYVENAESASLLFKPDEVYQTVKFLIVEDSRAMQSILRRILTSVGATEIKAAGNGVDALELLAADQTFEVALVDWNMPGMNGLEFVRKVRENSDLANLKMIMVTTETQQERIRDALEAGANEYVMKPFDKETLVAKLKLLGLVD